MHSDSTASAGPSCPGGSRWQRCLAVLILVFAGRLEYVSACCSVFRLGSNMSPYGSMVTCLMPSGHSPNVWKYEMETLFVCECRREKKNLEPLPTLCSFSFQGVCPSRPIWVI